MEDANLTVKVPKELLERAKLYAQEHDTTLSRLITTYLQQLDIKDDPLANAPIVWRLVGSLSQEVGLDDYRKAMEAKYG
jgi:hypothetical protein